MSDRVEKYSQFGLRRWKSSLTIPIELFEDKGYIEHIKKELKERCVKEYVENIEDSFEYSSSFDKTSRTGTISIELEDLFKLKENNKFLRKQIYELIDEISFLKAMEK